MLINIKLPKPDERKISIKSNDNNVGIYKFTRIQGNVLLQSIRMKNKEFEKLIKSYQFLKK